MRCAVHDIFYIFILFDYLIAGWRHLISADDLYALGIKVFPELVNMTASHVHVREL